MPLIQLYTGARIGEPSALSVDHFRNEAGIEVMHLPGTKSDSAARDIPIHPDLIKIGLIEFVEMRRKKGCATLFDLSISEQNGAGAAVTKFFSDFLRDKVGITNSGKVNHSFRHTLVRHLFQHSSPIEARKQYVGHSNNSGTEGTYLGTELLNLPDLKIAVVDKIDWQKYYGWSPDIAVLSAKAKEFL